MHDGDKPPIGILLCAKKDHALVEYALGEEDANNLFVSQYNLELPSPKMIQEFIEKELKND